jgi:chemotaxis protein CheD
VTATPPQLLPAETRFLNPGEWALGGPGDVLGTLLGSCVALVLWHPRMRTGAICHYVLPERDRQPAAEPDGRYGVEVLAMMSAALARRGVALMQCSAKLFGGARVYEAGSQANSDVGARNIACARAFLREAGLATAAEHVGGQGWRRLCFDAGTGEVWVRFNTQKLTILPRTERECS